MCLSLETLISNDLTQMVNFPTWIPDCDSHSPTLLAWSPPHLIIIMGGLNLKICQNFVGTKFLLRFVGWINPYGEVKIL